MSSKISSSNSKYYYSPASEGRVKESVAQAQSKFPNEAKSPKMSRSEADRFILELESYRDEFRIRISEMHQSIQTLISRVAEENAKEREENARRFDILLARINSSSEKRSPVKAFEDYPRHQYSLPPKMQTLSKESHLIKKVVPGVGIEIIVPSNTPLLKSDVVSSIPMKESETVVNIKISESVKECVEAPNLEDAENYNMEVSVPEIPVVQLLIDDEVVYTVDTVKLNEVVHTDEYVILPQESFFDNLSDLYNMKLSCEANPFFLSRSIDLSAQFTIQSFLLPASVCPVFDGEILQFRVFDPGGYQNIIYWKF